MKKLLAIVMALCLALTAVAVFAESNESVKTINWTEYQEKAAAAGGELTPINGTDLQIFIPKEFKETKLDEDAIAKGYIFVLKTEDGKAIANLQLVKLDVEAFKTQVAESGAVNLTAMDINGVKCTNFNVVAEGVLSTCIAVGTDQGSTLVFSFSPANQDPYTDLFRIMVASLQHAA